MASAVLKSKYRLVGRSKTSRGALEEMPFVIARVKRGVTHHSLNN